MPAGLLLQEGEVGPLPLLAQQLQGLPSPSQRLLSSLRTCSEKQPTGGRLQQQLLLPLLLPLARRLGAVGMAAASAKVFSLCKCTKSSLFSPQTGALGARARRAECPSELS
jgi:hypothetical protein